MPSINEALFAARAGIQSHGGAISVLADNIANANTVAFKQSRAEFSDLLAGNLSGGSGTSVGSGSEVNRITTVFNQGTFEFTGRGLDIGIDGTGFLIAQDNNNTSFYTRAGNLNIDAEGFLKTAEGLSVLGFPSDGAGGLEQINVNDRGQQDIDTDAVSISGNLDASTDILPGGVADIPGPFVAPAATGTTFTALSDASEFSTFVDVFDSLGGQHTATLFFYHTAANEWQVGAYVDGGEVDGGVAGEPFLIGSQQIDFNADGTKVPVVGPDFAAVDIPWNNGSDQVNNVDFTFAPFTQFASPSTIDSIIQDGTGAGSVIGVSIASDGTVSANLNNGQSAEIGTIALATFSNLEGLARRGGSLYAETPESGESVVGTPGAGQFGQFQAGSLEQSTSDIAADFIKLISFQRAFQSSSRIITNVDDLLQEITNLV